MNLQGQRIVITRSQEQAEPLGRQLQALGGEIIYFPTIQFVPLESERVAAARQQVTTYDWLLFTSRNAVTFFLTDEEMVQKLSAAARPHIAAVGTATANELTRRGLPVQRIPDPFTGDALATQLGDVRGQKILLPRSRLGRPDLVTQLQVQGAVVTDLPLYDTIAAHPSTQARQQLAQGMDMITFTSPSTVQNFCQMVPAWSTLLHGVKVVCIGPVTAAAAAQLGLTVSLTAQEHTAEGLIQAIKQGWG